MSGDVYFEDWSNIQQSISLACGCGFTANAAKARLYGGELEVEFKLTPSLPLSGNTGYSRARLTQVTPSTPFAKGDRLQSVSDWTWSANLEYRNPLNDAASCVARIGASHVGSRIDVTTQRNYLPGYPIADARAGIETGKWTYHLFVNNLTNKRAQLSDSNSYSVNVPKFNRVTTNQPRTFGVDVSRSSRC